MKPPTEEQKTAATHGKGCACVIAGAGTGKTFALTERIVHLVEKCGLDPLQILVTTFTRKATAELYDRAYKKLKERAQKLRISTIDSLILDLAKQAMHRGLMPVGRVIGEAEQRLLLLQSAWEVLEQDNRSDNWAAAADKANIVGLLQLCVQANSNEGAKKRQIETDIRSKLKALRGRYGVYSFRELKQGDLKKIVNRYSEKLKELGAIDYDSLRGTFLHCLRHHKKLADEFGSRFSAMLVDEFQDTSRPQAEILLMLCGKRSNMWVIGDPCQQIYEWRGAGTDNLRWFIRKTKAKKYRLMDNFRSTQPILDGAYRFLSARVPSLKKDGMLKPLHARRGEEGGKSPEPICSGTLDDALIHVKRLLGADNTLRPMDFAILSRNLNNETIKEIKNKARDKGLCVQFQSSGADRALEETIGYPPPWRPGQALVRFYRHAKIKSAISQSLRKRDFDGIRAIRPLAAAADALDSTLTPASFSFEEAWRPALKKTQDRDIAVTSAVVSRPEAIQVMTIHAAKGLEFPVVLLMKLGRGGSRSFPDPRKKEDSRLAYVGATRARDLLILIHTKNKPRKTLRAFGRNLVSISRHKRDKFSFETSSAHSTITRLTIQPTPPIVAATHLNLYAQCPLKFAAYHEGRFLPNWSHSQSMGSRMHKALEYYLRAGMPKDALAVDECFRKGFSDGDSSLRRLSGKSETKMRDAYRELVKNIGKTSVQPLAIEQRYRYVQGSSGQVEGVIDALLKTRNGIVVLKEWKTSSEISTTYRLQKEIQARSGVLGMLAQGSYPIHRLDIVPVFSKEHAISDVCSPTFVEESKEMLERVFKDIKDRTYDPKKGKHCERCQLKPQCPAHRTSIHQR